MACQNFLLVTELWTGWQVASGVCPFVLICAQHLPGQRKQLNSLNFFKRKKNFWSGDQAEMKKKKKIMSPLPSTHINTHRHTQTKWPLFGQIYEQQPLLGPIEHLGL